MRINAPTRAELLTGAFLPFVFFVPFAAGRAIWSLTDHPAAKVSAFLVGACLLVAMKGFYVWSVLRIESRTGDAG